ncbi:MAG TPA: ParB/RepB/Spo0J family partition protein [Burkholderiales bacterium]|nr:ParB/RepB/Spo0J family partition protein [Burkholderiales bacterium]HYA47475.1 ParB/RepB/Spo0J family partition protein [Burkholderiales bacterium]
MKLKGLGRGLDALLDRDSDGAPMAEHQATLRVEQLQRGRYQPRTKMDDASLQELAASIRKQGLMQPILVRPAGGERYEIIAGERRWRAAKIAGLDDVPVLVREVPDSAALAMALVENIQREDLNPLEEANGVQRLIDEFKLTHQEAAEAIGRSRTATTNLLRLRNLQKPVQAMVFDGRLEMGHARALLALEGRRQEAVARRVASRALSVRQTEELVNAILNPSAKIRRRVGADRDIARLEEELSGEIGTTIHIKPAKKGGGKLIVTYSSPEHLDDLLSGFRRRRPS